MKCRHPNCTIHEYTTMVRAYEFYDGEVRNDGGDEPQSGRRYEVSCDECGLEKMYLESRLPKWLSGLMKIATAHSDITTVTEYSEEDAEFDRARWRWMKGKGDYPKRTHKKLSGG